MIKLISLLKEINNITSAKLSPGEFDKYQQALLILKDETLEEGVVDKLKKLGLSATIISALLTSPQLTQAQKAPLQQLKSTTQTISTPSTNPDFWVKDINDIKKIQTAIKAYKKYVLAMWKVDKVTINNMDKVYSNLTPQEQIAAENRFMSIQEKTDVDGLNGEYTSKFQFPIAFLKDLNRGTIENLGLEGNKVLQMVNQSGLTTQQMAEWNQFVKWMIKNNYAGDKKMNNFKFSTNVLQQYKS